MGGLVLSRCREEKILIGKAGDVLSGPIVLTVVEIRSDKVRLHLEAQVNVVIHRQEVADAIAREESRNE